MSSQNETLVQRWWQELWNRGDLSVADQIIDPNWTDHDPSSPWAPPGIEGCKTLVSAYRAVLLIRSFLTGAALARTVET